MKYFLAISLICCTLSLFAQDFEKEKDFINQVITEKNIVYQDSLSKSSTDYLRHHLEYARENVFTRYDTDSVIYMDTAGRETRMLKSKASSLLMANGRAGLIGGRAVPIARDTIILSEQEIASILSVFERDSKRKWDKDLIPGARQLSADTITAVFKDHVWGWDKMHKKGVSSIYTFGPPVFIRDDAYCIFYSDNSCGYLCGSGKLAIYKKENGKWVFWSNIVTWIS